MCCRCQCSNDDDGRVDPDIETVEETRVSDCSGSDGDGYDHDSDAPCPAVDISSILEVITYEVRSAATGAGGLPGFLYSPDGWSSAYLARAYALLRLFHRVTTSDAGYPNMESLDALYDLATLTVAAIATHKEGLSR